MTSTVSPHAAPAPAVSSAKPHFRADVQGLRAVAVLLVLLYHGGLPWLPGGYVGVDVFFVISGFLITGLLIRELATTGTISLVDFYARRARRILPAALLVIALTVVAVVLWLPRSRWESIGWEGLGAAFSVVNWQFAAGTTDYLQQDGAPSPLQHYWSLAVEEQFYLVWPLLLLVLTTGMAGLVARGAARRRRASIRTTVGAAVGTGVGDAVGGGVGDSVRVVPAHRSVCRWVLVASVVVLGASLVHSVRFSPENPGTAYFITTTRIWELAVGAALAAALPLLPALAAGFRAVLGWAGLAGIVAAAAVFDAQTVFPGYAALLPVLGAAAVILAGSPGQDARWSPAVAVLSVRPMRFVGDISYSLYLVHWPVLTIVAGALFADELPARYGLPLAVGTVLPAWLCYRFVERPFMRWTFVASRRTALRTGAAGMVTVGLAALVLVTVPRVSAVDAPVSADRLPGAAALAQDPRAGVPEDTASSIYPSTAEASEDKAAVYDQECIAEFAETEPRRCAFGAEDADTDIVLIGDSHAASWFPAVQQAAESRGWQVHTFLKFSCPVTAATTTRTVDGEATEYAECAEWNEQVIDDVLALDPDLMVVSGFRDDAADDETVAAGMAEAWRRYTDAGVEVAVLNDVPAPGVDVPECVERHRDSLTDCAYDREEAIAASGAPQLQRAAELHGDVEVIDLNGLVCPPDQELCPVVIGGVLVYFDGHHVTATYSATLAGPVGDALAPLLGTG